MMTRKDYVEVARILNAFENDENLDTGYLLDSFIELFKKDNPRFDSKRFTEAVNE
jgi:hypothetical protein